MGKVVNAAGREIDFDAAVALMDDEIREQIHADLAPCTEQAFFKAYAVSHAEKYGAEWELNTENPVY